MSGKAPSTFEGRKEETVTPKPEAEAPKVEVDVTVTTPAPTVSEPPADEVKDEKPAAEGEAAETKE